MPHNLLVVSSALLTILLISPFLTIPVRANSGWNGNDNGEFNVGQCSGCGYLNNVGVEYGMSSNLQWTSPPIGDISLQYNPDGFASQWGDGEWVQSIIFSNAAECASFSIEVYNAWTGALDWRADYPASGCNPTTGIMNSGSGWEIVEYTTAQQTFQSVNFWLAGGGLGAGSMGYTLYPNAWAWYRSNTCLCGTNMGTASFTSGSGTIDMWSNWNLNAVNPPTSIQTLEDSNIQYGCFSGSGSTFMSQNFALSGAC